MHAPLFTPLPTLTITLMEGSRRHLRAGGTSGGQSRDCPPCCRCTDFFIAGGVEALVFVLIQRLEGRCVGEAQSIQHPGAASQFQQCQHRAHACSECRVRGCTTDVHACARRWWTAYVRASSPSHVLQPRSARARPGQARPGQASASPGKRPRGWPNSQAAAVFPCLLPCIWAAAQCSPGRSPRGGSCCTPLHSHAQWHRHPPAPISRVQLCTDSLAQPTLITQ